MGLSVSLPCQAGLPTAVPSFKKGSSLGFAVPSATKLKIWDGEFVDFDQLLQCNSVQLLSRKQQQSELVFAINDGGSMVVRPAVQPKEKVDTLDKWVSAFHVFMAIFIEKHSSRAAELLKYAETIRLAAAQFPGPNWRAYDEQFRLRRAADPCSICSEMDMELWVTVAAASAIGPIVHGYSSQNVSNSGRPYANLTSGVCNAFNRSRGCRFSPCKYAHKCSVCFCAGHSALTCRSGTQSNKQSLVGVGFAGNRSHAGKLGFGKRAPAPQYGGQRQLSLAGPQSNLPAAKSVPQGKPVNFRSSNAS